MLMPGLCGRLREDCKAGESGKSIGFKFTREMPSYLEKIIYVYVSQTLSKLKLTDSILILAHSNLIFGQSNMNLA